MIGAPPEQVYAVLVDPEALAEWLPPDGMSAESTDSMRGPAAPTD